MSGAKLKKAIDKKDLKAVEAILTKPKYDGNARSIKLGKKASKWSNEIFTCAFNVLGYAIHKHQLDDFVKELLNNPFLDVDAICFEQDFPKSDKRNLMSPIVYAIYRDNSELVRHLIDCRVDLHAKCWMDGPKVEPAGEKSPLDFARDHRPEMFKLIQTLVPSDPVEIQELPSGDNGTIRYSEK